MSVLNIYGLASEYNILRSIVSSIGKNIISIVPTPLLLPKLTEKTDFAYTSNLFVDIGYTHMTIASLDEGEFRYFETFPIGSKMLIDIIADSHGDLSYTQIESILMRTHPTTEERELRKSLAKEYFSYVIDALISTIERE
jgi:cell division ATPase FtsA